MKIISFALQCISKRNLLFLFSLTILCSHASAGLRILPPKIEIAPVIVDKVKISVPELKAKGSKLGQIEAHDLDTGKLLWKLQVFSDKKEIKNAHQKLQEKLGKNSTISFAMTYIKTLSYDKKQKLLLVTDNRNRTFSVELATRTVTQLKKK